MALNRRQLLTRSLATGTAAAIAGGLVADPAAGWDEEELPNGAAPELEEGERMLPAGEDEPLPMEPAVPDGWEKVRAQFRLSPRYIHMAGLLIASHPAPVRAAIERHRQGLDENPARYLPQHNRRLQAEVRRAAAAYLGARPQDIALTDSTTMGLGLLYNGLRVRTGQELLTSRSDYYSTYEALRYKSHRTGAPLRRIALYRSIRTVSEDEIVETLIKAVGPKTRVVATTWVHSSTGLKIPVRRIADALARINANRSEADRALLCVDGVHGLGVEDAAVRDLGCDFFVAGTHKWMFGPRGSGILWGNPRSQAALTPTIPTFTRSAGWGGRMSPGGFKPYEHLWAVAEAFRFHQRLGKPRVEQRIHALCRQLKEGLAGMAHVTLYTPMSDRLSAGIVCFDVRGMTPAQVVARLRQRNIIASTTPYSPTHARLTPGVYNTTTEIDRVLAAVRALA